MCDDALFSRAAGFDHLGWLWAGLGSPRSTIICFARINGGRCRSFLPNTDATVAAVFTRLAWQNVRPSVQLYACRMRMCNIREIEKVDAICTYYNKTHNAFLHMLNATKNYPFACTSVAALLCVSLLLCAIVAPAVSIFFYFTYFAYCAASLLLLLSSSYFWRRWRHALPFNAALCEHMLARMSAYMFVCARAQFKCPALGSALATMPCKLSKNYLSFMSSITVSAFTKSNKLTAAAVQNLCVCYSNTATVVVGIVVVVYLRSIFVRN